MTNESETQLDRIERKVDNLCLSLTGDDQRRGVYERVRLLSAWLNGVMILLFILGGLITWHTTGLEIGVIVAGAGFLLTALKVAMT